MKKKFRYLLSSSIVIYALTMFISLSSCGSGNTETGEDAEKYTEDDFSDLISQGDFDNAEFVLKEEINKVNKQGYMHSRHYGKAPKIYGMVNQLYKARAMDIIKNNGDASELAFLLSEYPIFGEKQEGVVDSDYEFDAYPVATNSFNMLCDNLLAASLAINNYDMAQAIVNLYMNDVKVFYKYGGFVVDGVEVEGGNAYSKISNTSKEAAQKKLDAAKAQ